MPNITGSGTVTKADSGWSMLESPQGANITLLFSGTTLGSTCEIQYTDDAGTDRTLAGGTITVLPTSAVIGPLAVDLKIKTTGSPNFNVTFGGFERQKT
jgi:type 1 fimbria pilin